MRAKIPTWPTFQYERRSEPLAPPRRYLKRLMRSIAIGLATVALALGLGVVGYRLTGRLGWLDSFYNASMILGGMGPVDSRPSIPGAEKVFASIYALFSGFFILIIAGVMFGPVFHRFIHQFHADVPEENA
jgi:hypothetical protein